MRVVTRQGREAFLVDEEDDGVIRLRPALVRAEAAALKPPADLPDLYQWVMAPGVDLDRVMSTLEYDVRDLKGDTDALPDVVSFRDLMRWGSAGPGLSDDEAWAILRMSRKGARRAGGEPFSEAVVAELAKTPRRPSTVAFIAALRVAKTLRPLTPQTLIGKALERAAVMAVIVVALDEIIAHTTGLTREEGA